MENDRSKNQSGELYRRLPSLNEVLLSSDFEPLLCSHPRGAVVITARATLQHIREEISLGLHTPVSLLEQLSSLPAVVKASLAREASYSLRRVINATGVILHTNLGRAPLSKAALDHVVEVACSYSNLELDLDSGERGARDVHVETLILALLGKDDAAPASADKHRAIVVNNCAAATFLALHALANGREVVVSRGELVEIGGGFRIPEILQSSGAMLKEIGTTNRTHLSDYASAISPATGLILRVHQSNFSMEGFVARPNLSELASLAKQANVPLFEDQGTGLVHSLATYGVEGEGILTESLARGCDLVAASGDKLLGGPQCGLLVGRKHLVERIRSNPLFRALRVDKLTYAALEGTLAAYLSGSPESIPIMRMLRLAPREIQQRCEQVAGQVRATEMNVEVLSIESLLGGGTAPRAKLQSYAIALQHSTLGADALLLALRRSDPPIIGRIQEGRVVLDLRTVEPDFDSSLIHVLNHLIPTESTATQTGI